MDDVINKTRSQRILNNIIQVGGATHCQQWDPQENENRPETGETHILRAGQMKDWHLLVSSKRRGSHSSVDLGTTDETGKGVHVRARPPQEDQKVLSSWPSGLSGTPSGAFFQKGRAQIEEIQLGVQPKMIRAGHLGMKERKCSNTSGGGDKRKQISQALKRGMQKNH